VTNAPNVELFIVWASMVGKNSDGSLAPKLTAFVVDSKNVPGVTVHKDQPYPVRGLKGTEICSVTFKNVIHSFRDVRDSLCTILKILFR
jgi:alkylation response protein AidB-like acyl-CoA dehydrogenase